MQTYQFEFTALGSQVKADDGTIRGVSIITAGVKAKGHDLEVDDITLLQMLDCAEKKGKVPVKWNHKTGADAVNGYLNNFRIEEGDKENPADGDKLKADWHLLKSHERYDHAMELAGTMAECVGLSASFAGQSELSDGTKVFDADEKTKHPFVVRGGVRLSIPAGEKKFARCRDLVSVDLVAAPAANPGGLFEAAVDTAEMGMADQLNPAGAAQEVSLSDVMAGIMSLQAGFNDLSARTAQLEDFATGVTESGVELEAGQEAEFGGTMDGAMRYLEARLNGIEEERNNAATENAFALIEDRQGKLLAFNEQLIAENAAMAEAIQEFSAYTGAAVNFSAGADGGYQPNIMLAEDQAAEPRTDFEARVNEFRNAGKEETDALMLAMKEDPSRYSRHLQAIGVYAKNL